MKSSFPPCYCCLLPSVSGVTRPRHARKIREVRRVEMSVHGPTVSATVAQSTLGGGEADSGTTREITFYLIVTLFARASHGTRACVFGYYSNPQTTLSKPLNIEEPSFSRIFNFLFARKIEQKPRIIFVRCRSRCEIFRYGSVVGISQRIWQ